MVRVAGLAILLGCAAAGLVWFGWGFVANVLATRRSAPDENSTEAPKEKDAAA
jgi:hypothetical protein